MLRRNGITVDEGRQRGGVKDRTMTDLLLMIIYYLLFISLLPSTRQQLQTPPQSHPDPLFIKATILSNQRHQLLRHSNDRVKVFSYLNN